MTIVNVTFICTKLLIKTSFVSKVIKGHVCGMFSNKKTPKNK